MLQQPPVNTEFSKEESLFGSCHTKDLSSSELGGEEDKSGPSKNRAKSESLMGSLKRRLSTKQKAKVKSARQGWYWGPITRWEAEEKLVNLADGSFLVRDSSDDRYLLSLSFRSQGKTLHTRIEHSNGRFSFYEQPDVEGHTSIVDLIEHSIRDSENGAFCYSRSRLPGSATYPVRLTNPVSRFMQVRSLQYLCRFVIRQYTRIDLIQKLPLPNKMKDYCKRSTTEDSTGQGQGSFALWCEFDFL
uniref:Suppressor of cytokine signaling 6 n=1 Tax=Neogobius melanostomus TaxID=47308 RepID=A0A8C6WUN4_9GOBI